MSKFIPMENNINPMSDIPTGGNGAPVGEGEFVRQAHEATLNRLRRGISILVASFTISIVTCVAVILPAKYAPLGNFSSFNVEKTIKSLIGVLIPKNGNPTNDITP